MKKVIFNQEEIQILKELGEKIKIARKQAKLNQEELAEKIGIDRTYVSMIERGTANISFLKLQKIYDELGMDFKI